MMRRTFFAVLLAVAAPAAATAQPLPDVIEFNRDIRPILSDACFHCHGPDKAKRKAGLRLDAEPGTKASRGGNPLLVPGKPEQSELFLRITARDESERMPPAASGRKLTAKQ